MLEAAFWPDKSGFVPDKSLCDFPRENYVFIPFVLYIYIYITTRLGLKDVRTPCDKRTEVSSPMKTLAFLMGQKIAKSVPEGHKVTFLR